MGNRVQDILRQVEARGYTIALGDNGNLKINGISGGEKLPTGLIEQIAVNKSDIVGYLQKLQNEPGVDALARRILETHRVVASPPPPPQTFAPPQSFSSFQPGKVVLTGDSGPQSKPPDPQEKRINRLPEGYTEKTLLAALMAQPGRSIDDYAKITGLKYFQVNDAARLLSARGLIKFGENKHRNRRLFFYTADVNMKGENHKMDEQGKPAQMDIEELTSPAPTSPAPSMENQAPKDYMSLTEFAEESGIPYPTLYGNHANGKLKTQRFPSRNPKFSWRQDIFVSPEEAKGYLAEHLKEENYKPAPEPTVEAPAIDKNPSSVIGWLTIPEAAKRADVSGWLIGAAIKKGEMKSTFGVPRSPKRGSRLQIYVEADVLDAWVAARREGRTEKGEKRKWRYTKKRKEQVLKMQQAKRNKNRGILRRIFWPFG